VIREDFITAQYIWALENEHVFVTKARHEAERNNFHQFRTLVERSTRELRRGLDDVPSDVEWAYLFIELWTRMGGYHPDDTDGEWHSDDANKYYYQASLLNRHVAKQPTQSTETTEETDMSNKITFKTITYINNADVTALTDEQLIDAIKTIEREIADLKGVTTKSKKIEAKIADAEATLAKVVEVLDAR
jgi:hypothetical protein